MENYDKDCMLLDVGEIVMNDLLSLLIDNVPSALDDDIFPALNAHVHGVDVGALIALGLTSEELTEENVEAPLTPWEMAYLGGKDDVVSMHPMPAGCLYIKTVRSTRCTEMVLVDDGTVNYGREQG